MNPVVEKAGKFALGTVGGGASGMWSGFKSSLKLSGGAGILMALGVGAALIMSGGVGAGIGIAMAVCMSLTGVVAGWGAGSAVSLGTSPLVKGFGALVGGVLMGVVGAAMAFNPIAAAVGCAMVAGAITTGAITAGLGPLFAQIGGVWGLLTGGAKALKQDSAERQNNLDREMATVQYQNSITEQRLQNAIERQGGGEHRGDYENYLYPRAAEGNPNYHIGKYANGRDGSRATPRDKW